MPQWRSCASARWLGARRFSPESGTRRLRQPRSALVEVLDDDARPFETHCGVDTVTEPSAATATLVSLESVAKSLALNATIGMGRP